MSLSYKPACRRAIDDIMLMMDYIPDYWALHPVDNNSVPIHSKAMDTIRKPDGFESQKIIVLPDHIMKEAPAIAMESRCT